MHATDAAAELTWGMEDESPEPSEAEQEPLMRQMVSSALRHRGWSVLERGDGTLALTVGPETLDALIADYGVPAVLSPSAARKARSIRNLRNAFEREPLAEELVSAGSSARD